MKKILIAVTNRARYEKVDRSTGLWLGELVHFHEEMTAAGIGMDIASPEGGRTPLDPESMRGLSVDAAIRAFQADPAKMALLERTQKASEVNAADYQAIYYTGGHGTMWDFPEEPSFQKIARALYEGGGWVAAVCHGVAGLINLSLSNGEPLVRGKRLTGYSDREEWAGRTREIVPYSLEDRLREKGAHYSRSFIPFRSHTEADGRLLTGQNPFSTKALAKRLRESLTASPS